ncbi:MAG: type toxin-antitoxin system prevent-host-death family antitoxin [Sphingomonas bacterium]|uniref:type II toxin-antitoxin system Phd/YefM family antitoxin n=1 Tax=Sphingomonas bacterium TaxID=1895847 RepID=UPI002618633C|nr:type II toxin-antitoxin system prevent-host-death family antitoxin [Sphingomonas bacterium]MDB5704438.1 type toxin-antitoxin system prevent-host-death family antitoxin [Sphingomonas bacterium]
MEISVSDAKARLTALVRHAEAGEDVILTRHGQPAARIVPIAPKPDRARRIAIMEEVRAAAEKRGLDGGPDAARSQDHLYDERGLPA